METLKALLSNGYFLALISIVGIGGVWAEYAIRDHIKRGKKETMNIFILLLAKEIIRSETGRFFHVVNTATVCRYLNLRYRPDLSSALEEIVQFDPTKSVSSQIPYTYRSFARHMWDKMDDLKFSRKNLDTLVRGIRYLGAYRNWGEFENAKNDSEGAIWANQFNGWLYEDIRGMNRRELDKQLDLYLQGLCSVSNFSGRFKGASYEYQIFMNQFVCLREAAEDNLKDLSKLANANCIGSKIDDQNLRFSIFKRNKLSTFVIENSVSLIDGCITILSFRRNSDERINEFLDTTNALDFSEKGKANLFVIKEIAFRKEINRDLLIENIYKIIYKYFDPGISSKSKNEIAILAQGDYEDLLLSHGFRKTKIVHDNLRLFVAKFYELSENRHFHSVADFYLNKLFSES